MMMYSVMKNKDVLLKTVKTLILAILAIFLLFGCAKPDQCIAPFVHIGNICCQDNNNNSICDMEDAIEEELESEETIPESETPPEEVEAKPEPVEEEPESEPTPEPVTASEGEAKKVVNLFAQSWKSKQYNMMYSFLTDKLKTIKTSAEFNAIMELNPSHQRITDVKVKELTFSGNTGKITFEFWTPVSSYETTDSKVIFTGTDWKIDGMVDIFYVDTFGAACGGFSKEYNKQKCAKDLSVKIKDTKYCERSKCYYTECIETIKKTLTKKEQVLACNLCPPVGKTNKECILDVAIDAGDVNICKEISESSYSDRYCKCWGGYARAKGSEGYCNMIENSEYKYLCQKGFQGKNC